MRYQKYNISQEVQDAFHPEKLLGVAAITKYPKTGWTLDRNEVFGASLFNRITVLKDGSNGYFLRKDGVGVAYLEDGKPDDPFHYKWYNNPDKTKATVKRLLVIGDPSVDAICVNPAFEVTRSGDFIMVVNKTTINGLPYEQVATNRRIRFVGFHWGISDVADTGIRGGLIASNGENQKGSSRPDYVKLSKNIAAIITADKLGLSQMNDNSVDYVLKTADIADTGVEHLTLQCSFDVKNDSEILRVPLQEIFKSIGL